MIHATRRRWRRLGLTRFGVVVTLFLAGALVAAAVGMVER